MGAQIKLKSILNEKVLLITFGKGSTPGLTKTRIRKVEEEDRFFYQEERIKDNKAYHKNLEAEDLHSFFENVMESEFKNSVIYSTDADYYIRRSKKGSLSIMKRDATKSALKSKSHNIEKAYIIPEGKPVEFLVEIGIMSKDGQVYKNNYSKFRQINRFIELIDDEYERFKYKKIIKVSDLCCGKGYLTLAVHHYFSVIKNMKTEILGMDLKEDVIVMLNNIVKKLNLSGIVFKHGDIQDAELKNPDIVVALHACDIATDIALEAAVKAEAGLIMAVPCCQHELFNQIKNEDLSPILKYGIMKDKFTELSTNALRGLALEARGYQVKMIEFTSIEHTMKNILIKAEKLKDRNPSAEEEFYRLSTILNVSASAQRILKT